MVVAEVTASQNAARPGSAEHAPHVRGSPVHTGSAAGTAAADDASVIDHSFLPPFFVDDLMASDTALLAEGGEVECESGWVTVYQSLVAVVRLR